MIINNTFKILYYQEIRLKLNVTIERECALVKNYT